MDQGLPLTQVRCPSWWNNQDDQQVIFLTVKTALGEKNPLMGLLCNKFNTRTIAAIAHTAARLEEAGFSFDEQAKFICIHIVSYVQEHGLNAIIAE